MRIGTKSKEKKKRIGQLRRSQLITTFGSGAITDLPDYSIIMGAIDYWSEKSPVIRYKNLENLLNV